MFRLPETFALPPPFVQPNFGTFVPCLPILHMHPRFSVLRITRWRDARPSEARKQGSQALVDSPAPPYSYSLVSRETSEDNPRQQRESDTRPGWRFAALTASVLAALVLRPGAGHRACRAAQR